jgi:hypothetical protein
MDSLNTRKKCAQPIDSIQGIVMQKNSSQSKKTRLTRSKPGLALLCTSILASSAAWAEEITIDSRDFIPIFGSAIYAESGAGNLVCSGPNGSQLFIAQLPFPPAPVELDLKQIAIWGGDFSASDASVSLDRYCQSEFSASTPVKTSIASLNSSGNGGNYFDSVTLNRRIDDQQTCIYMISLQLGLDSCSGGGNLSLARVRARFDVVQPVVIDPIFSNGFEN